MSEPARPIRILVAGDRAVSRDLLTMVLRGLRYDVRTAAAGADALARLESEFYALVLVDATLPDMDGCELVRRIRGRADGGGGLPVVVLGDNGDACVPARCLEAGAQGHLPKPLQLDRLLAVVRRMTSPRVRGGGAGGGGPSDMPVMDHEHLRGFTDGDAQLEQELGALYLATADLYLARMAAALDGGSDWSSAAHALKGASANLGARRVAALAAAAEEAPADPDRIAGLRRAVGEVRAFFERGRG